MTFEISISVIPIEFSPLEIFEKSLLPLYHDGIGGNPAHRTGAVGSTTATGDMSHEQF